MTTRGREKTDGEGRAVICRLRGRRLRILGFSVGSRERHNSFSFDNRLIGKNYQTIVRHGAFRRAKWMCLGAEESPQTGGGGGGRDARRRRALTSEGRRANVLSSGRFRSRQLSVPRSQQQSGLTSFNARQALLCKSITPQFRFAFLAPTPGGRRSRDGAHEPPLRARPLPRSTARTLFAQRRVLHLAGEIARHGSRDG